MTPKRSALLVFTGGLLPVLAFAFVDEYYGPAAGVVAGIVFGLGEVAFELWTLKKVQGITIVSNTMVVVLGGLSLWKSNGVLFKLQPAFLVLAFAFLLIGSSILKKPFLVELTKKQNPNTPEGMLYYMSGLNLRLGFVMIGIALVGVHAAYYWSTAMWATYKAVLAPILMVIYMVADIFIVSKIRKLRANRQHKSQ